MTGLLLAALLCAAPARAEDVKRNLETLIGRIAAKLTADEYGTLENPLLTDWVNDVGARVAQPCPRQEFPFRFGILDSPEANAYSLPAAHIFVTRGLLARVGSDDELAGVLAHEVGHVADRDFRRIVARQLMFLGLHEGLQRADQRSLTPVLGVVQLLNTLRHSRRQEDQADLRGVEYSLAARYDPLALTAFFDLVLGGRDEPREWYQGVLQTHPDAYRRRERTIERWQRLVRVDSGALPAIAADLAARRRYSAALQVSELCHTLSPEDVGPLVEEATIRLVRGEREACRAACRRALLVAPGDAEALRLAAEAEALSDAAPVPEPGVKGEGLLLDEGRLQTLKRLGKELGRDRRFSEALTWAQAYRPEAGDWRWAYLVLRTQVLLMATDRLRWRVSEVARTADAGAAAWADVTVIGDTPVPATAAYDSGVRHGIEAGKALRVAMRLLPTVLASLVMTGDGDPLGRMNSTRFALMEADLLAAERQTRSALEDSRCAARDIATAEVERYAAALNTMAAQAAGRQLAIYHGLAANRFGLTEEVVASACAAAGGLGAACRTTAFERAGVLPDAEPTYEQAEAVRIILRLLTCEAKAETIPPPRPEAPATG
jgi:Zn-dependent protease with chaperone function